MTVKYWTSPNDANHRNSHAEVDAIHFIKFPYQPYLSDMINGKLARISNFTQVVEGECKEIWIVSIFDHQPPFYRSISVGWYESLDKDEAFEWAAKQLKGETDEKPNKKDENP